mgnify:CR=1 FL=1
MFSVGIVVSVSDSVCGFQRPNPASCTPRAAAARRRMAQMLEELRVPLHRSATSVCPNE